MLKTERNTQAIDRSIRAAVRDVLDLRHFQTDFEHGQWWVTDLPTGRQWSVVDASGLPVYHNGFDFEQVSEGQEA